MSETFEPRTLPIGHQLDYFKIEKVLGAGGFGVTYLAEDTRRKQKVAIKEYFPKNLVKRAENYAVTHVGEKAGEYVQRGLERFVTEANTARLFTHPNIVKVHSILRENNTAYMVMTYEHGRTLTEVLQAGEKFDEQQLRDLILPILDGVRMMHNQGFIHRDIKPSNIFIRNDRTPVLIDFESARFALDDEPITLTSFISPGYASAEQYSTRGDIQGPWTDIYSLAATAFRVITGRRCDESFTDDFTNTEAGHFIWMNLEKHSDDYSIFLLSAIELALRLDYLQRPQTADEWQQMLTDPTYSFKRQRELEREDAQSSQPKSGWKSKRTLIGIMVAISAVVIASIYFLFRV